MFASPALASPVLANTTVALLEAREGAEAVSGRCRRDPRQRWRAPGSARDSPGSSRSRPELLSDRNTIKKLVASGSALELDRHLAGAGSAEVTRVAASSRRARGGRTIDVTTILRP